VIDAMKNMAFVIWVIGWPLMNSVTRYLDKPDLSPALHNISVIVIVVVWVVVANALYERQ
jgi:hypothetical protein